MAKAKVRIEDTAEPEFDHEASVQGLMQWFDRWVERDEEPDDIAEAMFEALARSMAARLGWAGMVHEVARMLWVVSEGPDCFEEDGPGSKHGPN